MELTDLIKYSEAKSVKYIAGSKSAELNYLQFHYKRFLYLLNRIKRLPKGELLDIGTTPFSLYLQENTGHQVSAFDFNDLQKSRCENYNIRFSSGDICTSELPYSENSFDIILFAEVFEHLHTDPIGILRKLQRILKPGGTLILGTPNMASLANRIKLLFNLPFLDYPTYSEVVHGHDRIYFMSEVCEYIQSAGFKLNYKEYTSCVDFISSKSDSLKSRILKKLGRIVSIPLRVIFPSLNGTIIISAIKA